MPSPSYLIVIGTSAGGLAALTRLVAQLPATLPAAVLVVQHLAPDALAEHLVAQLAARTGLRCQLATDGTPLAAGHLYLAPPDRHLLVKNERLLVTKGPRENGYRPAVDALFRAAAVEYDSHVVGVVLTGLLHDGTAGLDFVKRCGGVAVVQTDAEYPSMPESARRQVAIDYAVPLAELGSLLVQLVQPAAGASPAARAAIPADVRLEASIAERVALGTAPEAAQLGQLVSLTCPDCGGPLWEVSTGNVLRFRCHTGHAYTADALAERAQQALEETLWVALRMLEERRSLLSSLASHGSGPRAQQQAERVADIKQHINRLREFLLSGSADGSAAPEAEPAL